MKHKKLKIFAIIVLIILIGLLFLGNCKKTNALSYGNIYIGEANPSPTRYDHHYILFNLPLAYITPGQYYRVMTSSSGANMTFYVGEGTLTITSSGGAIQGGNINTTINYLDAFINNEYHYYYENQVTEDTCNNLILCVDTAVGTSQYPTNTNTGMINIFLMSYWSDANLFLRAVGGNNDLYITKNVLNENLKAFYLLATETASQSTSTTNFNDLLSYYTITNSSFNLLDENDLIDFLNNNRIFVSFYQWGIRAIGGDYYDEGYSEGYNAGVTEGYENGYDTGYDTGYNTGYTTGYDEGVSGETLFSPAFRIISDIFGAIGSIMAVELVPNVPLGLFILVPLFFSVLGLILWIWRRN